MGCEVSAATMIGRENSDYEPFHIALYLFAQL
jgi:hypothetical protein